jgi:hypothetical protein
MPDTRPGSQFLDSICLACRNYENRKNIDWSARASQLEQLCRDRIAQGGQYDCVCPVSGGKDSTVIVGELVNLGMRPLLVTVTDEFTKTKAGSHNLKNISSKFNLDHLVFRHAPQLFIENTRRDFENELHPLKWIEQKIYETPIEVARRYDIPLVFFGESSDYEYGVTNELNLLHPASDDRTQVYFFFAFKPYNETQNWQRAKSWGFRDLDDFDEWFRQGNIENFTQIDSIAYLIQLWTKFPKFGFQRVTDIASRMVRKGQLSKEQAQRLIRERDYICDPAAKRDFCKTLSITEDYFDAIVDRHANREILIKDENNVWRRRDLLDGMSQFYTSDHFAISGPEPIPIPVPR